MAGSSKPGPLAAHNAASSLNDGTLVRALTPAPGITHQGSAYWEAARARQPAARRGGGTPAAVFQAGRQPAVDAVYKTLRRGDSGPEVQRLQRALNLQLNPSPLLRPDGVFGPFTEAAVLRFQSAHALRADGVVGRQTWFHLARREAPPAVRMAVAAAVAQLPAAPAAPGTPTGTAAPEFVAPLARVAEWSLDRRFSEVLQRTAPKLPASMQREFMALLTPTSLAIMAGTLVVWAGAHAFGVGQAVDIVLLLGGAFMIGWAIGDVAKDFASFLSITCTADSEAELDEAATHLARAIAVIGIAAFAALLAKVAGRVPSQRRGTAGAPAPAPRAPKPAAPAPAPRPAPAAPAPAQSKALAVAEPAPLTLQQARAVAAQPGASAAQRKAREMVARDFYATNSPGMKASEIDSHLAGIDFSKPVVVETLPPGQPLFQHSKPGSVGQYFTKDASITADAVGVSDVVLMPPSGTTPPRIVPRVQTTHQVQQPLQALRTTAAPITDTWSLPGQSKITQGGAEQLFIPRGSHTGLSSP